MKHAVCDNSPAAIITLTAGGVGCMTGQTGGGDFDGPRIQVRTRVVGATAGTYGDSGAARNGRGLPHRLFGATRSLRSSPLCLMVTCNAMHSL